MTPTRVVLRVDADADIGIGHAMRCITLGAACTEIGMSVTIAAKRIPESLIARALDSGLTVERLGPGDEIDDVAVVARLAPDLLMADGYALAPFVAAAKARGLMVGVIDDANRMHADAPAVVIDGNLDADPGAYRRDALGCHLVGARYALVRSDLALARKARHDRRPGRNVLVAMGGADPARLSMSIVDALQHCDVDRIVVAAGPANPERNAIAAAIETTWCNVHLDRGALVESYAETDVAIIGAGSTLWECAALGIPAVAVVVADNQELAGQAAERAGFAITIEGRGTHAVATAIAAVRALLDDGPRRRSLGDAGTRTIDGRGATRVAHALQDWLGRTRA